MAAKFVLYRNHRKDGERGTVHVIRTPARIPAHVPAEAQARMDAEYPSFSGYTFQVAEASDWVGALIESHKF